MAKDDRKLSREDCLKIAARIREFSDQILPPEPLMHHIALKVKGLEGPYSNAVIVSDSGYVKFLIPSTELRERSKEEGFAPKLVNSTGPWAGSGFRFWGLTFNDIQAHEGLFRALVQESVNEIEHRKGHVKKR